MGCRCSKLANHTLDGLDDKPKDSVSDIDQRETAALEVEEITKEKIEEDEERESSKQICLAPTPAVALLLDKVKHPQQGSQPSPIELLQTLLDDHEKTTSKPFHTHGFVCTPSRYLHTSRPCYSIRESIPVRARTHRGEFEGYFTPTAASSFGAMPMVTARSDGCSLVKGGGGPQCFNIATEGHESDMDYCYSETVWSRLESQNSADWDFEWDGKQLAAPNNDSHKEEDKLTEQSKPSVPTLNMELVAAIAARENAYLRMKQAKAVGEKADTAAVEGQRSTTGRQPHQQSSRRQNLTTRSHKRYKGSYSPLVWKEPDWSRPAETTTATSADVDIPKSAHSSKQRVAFNVVKTQKGNTDRYAQKATKGYQLRSMSDLPSTILCTQRQPHQKALCNNNAELVEGLDAVQTEKETGESSVEEQTVLPAREEESENKIAVDSGKSANRSYEESTCCTELASISHLVDNDKQILNEQVLVSPAV